MPGGDVAGRAPIGIGDGVIVDEHVREGSSHLGDGHQCGFADCRAFADLHDLDEPRDDAAFPRETGQRLELGVVLAAEDDGVQLELVEPGCARGLDPGEHVGEASAAGQPEKSGGIEAVDRNRHAGEPSLAEGRGELGEASRIRRHRQVVEPERRQKTDAVDDAGVQQRLAARDADAAHAGEDEAARHRLERVVVELVLEVAVVTVRAAVDAREIAPIRQRETHATRRRRRAGRGREKGQRAAG